MWFMEPPEVLKVKRDYVCKLNRPIYDLHQAPKLWNDKLNGYLITYGFICCKSEPCLYYKTVNDVKVYLLVCVDDIMIGCSWLEII